MQSKNFVFWYFKTFLMISSLQNVFLLFSLVFCFVGGKNHDVCLLVENENLCQIKELQSTIVCAGGMQEEYRTKNDFVTRLSLCHWPNEIFDPQDVLSSFPNVEKFTLTKSEIKKISKDFPGSPTLKELNISYTSIEYLERTVFSELKFLNILDLRHNKLRFFDPNSVSNLKNLANIYLAGNYYHCDENFLWVTSANDAFVSSLITDIEEMICGRTKYNGKPLKRVVLIMETLKKECRNEILNNCTCILDHVIRVGNSLRPMITVNCTQQNFVTLPTNLPNFTSTLIMRSNMISNLSEFITNESYFKLLNVYLDYNRISSINVLAVSSWLLTFRALSLKGNNLSEVPLYALENVFERNRNIGKFLLSENPWKCDCTFGPLFKDFLVKYRSIIRDVSQVKCAAKDNDKNSLVPILLLKRNEVCTENIIQGISFLKLLNICFAFMLIILFADFARNYYMYKKHGQLPWIVDKIPL